MRPCATLKTSLVMDKDSAVYKPRLSVFSADKCDTSLSLRLRINPCYCWHHEWQQRTYAETSSVWCENGAVNYHDGWSYIKLFPQSTLYPIVYAQFFTLTKLQYHNALRSL